MIAVIAQLVITFTFSSQPAPSLWRTLTKEIAHSPIDGVCWSAVRSKTSPVSVPSPTFSVDVRGVCELPPGDVPWRSEPLGWVEIVDGRWVPEVHLDCSRIAEAARRGEDSELYNVSQQALARAMAVVVRHELHHLIRQTREHSTTGDFRFALAGRDLVFPLTTERCTQ